MLDNTHKSLNNLKSLLWHIGLSLFEFTSMKKERQLIQMIEMRMERQLNDCRDIDSLPMRCIFMTSVNILG